MVFRIPDDKQSLLSFGESSRTHLPNETLRVLVWNVWKGRKGERWRKDFLSLSADRDLVLIQEAVTDEQMTLLWRENQGRHEWHMAASFEWALTQKTGVITGTVAPPREKKFLRGLQRELFLWTPKVSLSTLFERSCGTDSLLVINTHVVNFTTTASFVEFVKALISLIESHKGPLLLAGDFNTWSTRRWQSLLEILAHLHMEPVDFHADPRLLRLDHVFVRGLKPIHAQIRSDIQSSDHYPLLVDLRYK